MNRIRFAFRQVIVVLAVAAVSSAMAEDRVPAKVREVMDGAKYKQAHWGLLAVELKSGDVRFELNSDKLFAPASVTKCFSVACALDTFGSDHRFETPIVRRGEINDKGELAGDLVLIASGDLTMGGRTSESGEIAFTNGDHTYASGGTESELTPQDPLAGLNELAAQVAKAGIKRVRGDVLIDDRLFDKAEGSGSGPGRLTPIYINDNAIDFTFIPTKAGQPAEVKWRPESKSFRVELHLETVAKNGKTETSVRDLGGGRYSVHGSIAEGHKPVLRVVEASDANSFARTLLIDALTRNGVEVLAPAAADHPHDKLPPRDETLKLPNVAKLLSPPFAENARLILKVSHNLHASTLPLLVAAKHGERTLSQGLRRQHDFLKRAGVDVDTISFGGGAGGSRSDYTTPAATVQLLRYMATRSDFELYRRALPRLGIDGTLSKSVGSESPAKDKVQAKTGTLYWDNTMNNGSLMTSKALAGYMTTAKGETLAFALFVNNAPIRNGLTTTVAGKDLGHICELLFEQP
jgi:D-alanyl-D-alanine carboxypeptidase/D-alanyl-D-alanine-endopeptidase (penicillin-binding protein 4)